MSHDSPSTASELPLAASRSPAALYADRLVVGIARHWLALFNLAVGFYLLLPFLAPTLMELGWTAPARVIYGLYSLTCHQLPDHSYFLFGAVPTPDLATLEGQGLAAGLDMFGQRRYVGSPEFGFKVALCQRDVAIYGSVLLAGLAFGLLRNRLRSPSFKLYALLLVPIALDGFTQLFGLRTSNWWLRSLTGALFGAASVWLAYPYIHDAMLDVVIDVERQANRRHPAASAQGADAD